MTVAVLKKCGQCGQEKPLHADYFHRSGPAFRAICKVCHNERQRARHSADPQRYAKTRKAWRDNNAEYLREKRADARKNNGEKYRAYNKKWKMDNRERCAEHTRTWRAKNPESDRKSRSRSLIKNRDCPKFRINRTVRTQLHKCLRGGKQGKTFDLLGYTASDLCAHLERQFAPRMGWHNYGEWHVDHIRPISLFNFETARDPEFKDCWSLTNLRPVWAKLNLRKSNKREFLL